MYLARFKGDGGAIVQGAIRFAPEGAADDPWWRVYRRYAHGLAGIRGPGAAFRFRLRPDGAVERLVSVLADDREEATLRRLLGRFALLDGIIDASIELPLDRPAFDSALAAFPKHRFRLAAPVQSAGAGIWLAQRFWLAPLLDALFAEAAPLGHAFAYQANVMPFRPGPDLVRAARKNAVKLRHEAEAPADLLAYQEDLASNLASATALVDEYVAADDNAASAWLAGAIERRFAAATKPVALTPPELRPDAGEAIASGLHRAALFGLEALAADEIVGAAASDDFAEALLDLRPPSLPPQGPGPDNRGGAPPPPHPHAAAAPIPEAPAPADVPAPPPYDGRDPFTFISYKRQDLARIAPFLTELAAAGHRLWFDRGIPGGSEWDEVLETKIATCQALLMFVSRAAVESKYCRREVKFADALDKTILAVTIEPADLGHGLKMLLHQYQMLDAQTPDFIDRLRQTLRDGTAASKS